MGGVGSIVGVIGDRSGLALEGTTILGPGDPLPEVPGRYLLDHTLSQADSVTKSHAVARLLQLRRAGAAIFLISHDELLLESCADEIWWGDTKGDPSEVLGKYRLHVAEMLRSTGNQTPRLSPTMRQGDGRASIEEIDLSSTVWQSGETAAIRVKVLFAEPVADPVIGIMLRTRIGLNVYGTNTELEQLKLGPVNQGETRTVTFEFACNLCPGQYTVTAASHDPDGVWHDWREDAVAFAVADSRYTAGVANLRAKVTFQ